MTEGKLSKKEVWEAMKVCCDHWGLAHEKLMMETLTDEIRVWQLVSFQQAILAEAWLDRDEIYIPMDRDQVRPQSLPEALCIVERSYLMFKREGCYHEVE